MRPQRVFGSWGEGYLFQGAGEHVHTFGVLGSTAKKVGIFSRDFGKKR